MVDKMVHADEIRAESSFKILESNVLTANGFFTEAGIIENIAQTSALQAGYLASIKNLKTPEGMIGGIKNMEIYFLPKINDTVKTTVTIEHEVMNAKIMTGTVFLNKKIVARCEMKVFLF